MDDNVDTPGNGQRPARTLQGVALDLDGLLFDTEPLYWQVGSQLLDRRGHRFTDQLQRRMMGRPGVQAMQVLIDALQLTDLPETLLEESNDLYAEMLTQGVTPMRGLLPWFDALEASGLPFGVATSSLHRFADQILRQNGLRDRIQFLLTGEDVRKGKPDPEMYLLAAKTLGIDPANMLVLEDSENGCAAAVAAGSVAVAIPGVHCEGHSYPGAHLVADGLDDARLLGLLTTKAG